jgi:nucleotide-binding universal stress UspA family protein
MSSLLAWLEREQEATRYGIRTNSGACKRRQGREEAIKIACLLAKKAKGKIEVLYVIRVRRTLPLEAQIEPEIRKGEETLDKASAMADQEDFTAETELLQAREIGPAIVEEAVDKEVNLVIIGLDYKKRFGEFSLGSVVPQVLRDAPCRVIVCREPAPTSETTAQSE